MTETMVSSDERTRAAVAYILTWITGLVILLTARKTDKYVRWHAIQAIGLGIALFVLAIIVNVLGAMMALGGAGMFGFMGLGGLVWILGIVLIIILAVKAYQGESFRLPVIADFADKNA